MAVDKEIEKFFEDVHGVVEANSFEMFALWKDNKEQGHEWVENLSGIGKSVGTVGGNPVFVSLLWNRVRGKKILFVDATSQVVDHSMVEDWLQNNLPKSAMKDNGNYRKTDAMNFHCLF